MPILVTDTVMLQEETDNLREVVRKFEVNDAVFGGQQEEVLAFRKGEAEWKPGVKKA